MFRLFIVFESLLSIFCFFIKYPKRSQDSQMHKIASNRYNKIFQKLEFLEGVTIYFELSINSFQIIRFFLIYINGEFEIEQLPRNLSSEIISDFESMVLINVDQKLEGENKRILKLSLTNSVFFHMDPYRYSKTFLEDIPFNVTSESNPHKSIFSGQLTEKNMEYQFILENINKNEWIKLNIDLPYFSFHVHYSTEFLNTYFSRNKFTSSQKRLNKINIVLGCKIITFEREMLSETIKNIY